MLSPTFSSEGLSIRALATTGVLLNSVVWVVVVVVAVGGVGLMVVVAVVVAEIGEDVPLVVTVEDLPLL